MPRTNNIANADGGVRSDLALAGAERVYYRDGTAYAYSETSGQLTVVGETLTTIGVEGNVELGVAGQAVCRNFTPKTAEKYHCGTSALPFAQGWFTEGVRTKCVSAATANPPTQVQIMIALGAAAAYGQGGSALLWDTNNNRLWLCMVYGISWYIEEMQVA